MEDRLLHIIKNELETDYAKLEQKMEEKINSNDDIDTKVKDIKDILHEMSNASNSIGIWAKMMKLMQAAKEEPDVNNEQNEEES